MDALMAELAALSAEGGVVFWALVALAFGIAFALLSVGRLFQLPDAPLLTGPEWRRLITDPSGHPSELARVAGHSRDFPVFERRFFDRLERRVRFASVLAGAAPLVGLLGTVTGMLATFDGLAASVTRAPVDVISGGVSEALITTQTGLVIGVPASIVCALAHSHCRRLRDGFHQVEAAVSGLARAR